MRYESVGRSHGLPRSQVTASGSVFPVEDYPRDRLELEARFSTEAACREYLAQLRWPEGFRCPHCGGNRAWPVRGVLLECAACGVQTSVISGTIFQDTRTPLPVWFRAMWWVTTQNNGASAVGLQRFWV